MTPDEQWQIRSDEFIVSLFLKSTALVSGKKS